MKRTRQPQRLAKAGRVPGTGRSPCTRVAHGARAFRAGALCVLATLDEIIRDDLEDIGLEVYLGRKARESMGDASAYPQSDAARDQLDVMLLTVEALRLFYLRDWPGEFRPLSRARP